MKKSNILFHYLHRDEGNYKIFGNVIFSNPEGISLQQAEKTLRKKLIDSEYFYPTENQVPLFIEHTGIPLFSDWYEFENLDETAENPTDSRSLTEFLHGMKAS